MHSSTIGIIITSIAMMAAPVVARGAWAGGIDMSEACRQQMNDPAASAYNNGGSAWDWHCQISKTQDIDTEAYCQTKYKNGAQQGAVSDPQGGGQYDWGCYFP